MEKTKSGENVGMHILEDASRPFEILLDVKNLSKKDIGSIIKETKYLNSKAYKKGDYMKLTFKLEDAQKITLEQFADLMYDSTHRHITGYFNKDHGNMICYGFGKEKDKNPLPRTKLKK